MRRTTKTRRSPYFYLLFKRSRLGHVSLHWEFNTNYSRYLPYVSGIHFCPLPAYLLPILFFLHFLTDFSETIFPLTYLEFVIRHNIPVTNFCILFFSLFGRLFCLGNKDFPPLTATELYNLNLFDFYSFKKFENEKGYYE